MAQPSAPMTPAWRRPMQGRDANESHRASTPLELFFDLCFVAAVSLAARSLLGSLEHGETWHALTGYAMVFFAIWWAWMNFTWFASAYDTDDLLYRLTVFVQLTGALILAAGVPQAFEQRNFTIVTAGYTVMRLPLAAQWLRAARADASRRTTAKRYAIGVSILQAAWI